MHKIIQTNYFISDLTHVAETGKTRSVINANMHIPQGRHSDCLIYVIEGECTYTFSDKRVIKVSAGDVLYLAKGSKYVMEISSEIYTPIFVDFTFIRDGECLESEKFKLKNPQLVHRLYRKLYTVWHFRSLGYMPSATAIFYEIYGQIIKQTTQTYISENKMLLISDAHQTIIREFSDPKLSVVRLAELSNMSEGHFRRLFKLVYGSSPIEYIRGIRLDCAKNLLMHTDLTIREIADKSGFNDIFYFSKAFKSTEKLTPSDFREKFKNTY